MVEKIFINQIDYSQQQIWSNHISTSWILHYYPSDGYDNQKSVMNLSFCRENVKSFSKGPFLSHFLYFYFLLQIIHRMSNANKNYTTMYSYFST